MTNDEMQKLASGLADCGKALLRMADALMEKKEEAPAAKGERKPEKKLSLENLSKPESQTA